MPAYRPQDLERKWQGYWKDQQTFRADNDSQKPKYYVLDMFPYPSGAGLHVGHPLGYIASDIVARYQRLQGRNVLHPMGFDSFGLPAEQYAIQTGQHPALTTEKNIATYVDQLQKLGFSYDWEREVRTSDPDYYKWTQWIFLKLFGSWYNLAADRAEPIATLEAHLTAHGSAGVQAAGDDAERPALTAAAWQALDEAGRMAALLPYRLAYQQDTYVNWCAALGTVLSNDEVKDGLSERGGYPVERRLMPQWNLRITAYADRLLAGLDTLDWPEAVKEMQRNWIGRSVGAEVVFDVLAAGADGAGSGESPTGAAEYPTSLREYPTSTTENPTSGKESVSGSAESPTLSGENPADEVETGANGAGIRVYTTRVDTIYGATFLVLAPEHELVAALTTPEQRAAVEEYVAASKRRSERDRMADTKTVSGVFTGSYARNPVSGVPVPIWLADYVLAGYGTGAVMAVPSGDQRDWVFATHFGMPIVQISDAQQGLDEQADPTKEGRYVNSGMVNGLGYKEATAKLIAYLEATGHGRGKINFRLRDAIFGRQRYWGEPIPIYYKDGTAYPLPETELPLVLPEIDEYRPTETGEPPLGRAKDWKYQGEYEYELSTMPGWAGSSWYYLRYMDPHNAARFVGEAAEEYWGQVDLYLGGAEHATGHLLYARFWYLFLKDLGLVHSPEPFQKLVNQGMILGRSNFVYRVSYKVIPVENGVSKPAVEPASLGIPPIFISKQRLDDVVRGGDMLLAGLLDDLEPHVKKYAPHSEAVQYPIHPLDRDELVTPLHADVSLVDNDVLDVEAFRNWREEYVKAKFILEENGTYVCGVEVEKMSKSKYNVVNPDVLIDKFGADALRLYEMFLGPLEQFKPWNTNGITGVAGFLKKFWRLFHPEDGALAVTDEPATAPELKVLHRVIQKVAQDIDKFSFNTSVSTFMIAVNELTALGTRKRAILEPLTVLLSPFAPHLAEELWQALGHDTSISFARYPEFREEYLVESSVSYPLAVNGKVREQREFAATATAADIEAAVRASDFVARFGEGKPIRKVVVVPGRMVNVVV